MNVAEQKQGAVVVLKPDGPLTVSEADEFKGRLIRVHHESLGRLVLDASEISFVDSRGLETLVEVTQEMAYAGQTLKLCAANQTLGEVLKLTGLWQLFEHFEDANSAVRSFL